jgi:hypothetical protein
MPTFISSETYWLKTWCSLHVQGAPGVATEALKPQGKRDADKEPAGSSPSHQRGVRVPEGDAKDHRARGSPKDVKYDAAKPADHHTERAAPPGLAPSPFEPVQAAVTPFATGTRAVAPSPAPFEPAQAVVANSSPRPHQYPINTLASSPPQASSNYSSPSPAAAARPGEKGATPQAQQQPKTTSSPARYNPASPKPPSLPFL